MRIIIKQAEGKNIRIMFPSRLVFNRLSAALIPLALKDSDLKIDRGQAWTMVKTILDCRRRFPNWSLVEVDSADGEHIRIKL